MSRETVVPLVLAALVVGGTLVGARFWEQARAEEARAAHETRVHEREEREERELADLRDESLRLMPQIVDGVALGMSHAEVLAMRPRMEDVDDGTDLELDVHAEQLASGGQVVFLFERSTDRLVQLQVLSLLPATDAIAPHLVAMNERYGTPTGIWDCPLTGDVPTRRFTWRFSHVAVSDVFLISAAGVSVTLFVTTADRTEISLRRGACRPVAADAIDAFPVADHVPTDD